MPAGYWQSWFFCKNFWLDDFWPATGWLDVSVTNTAAWAGVSEDNSATWTNVTESNTVSWGIT